MKVLTLKLNGQEYMTAKISAFYTKEAMKIQKDALAMAEKAINIATDDIGIAAEVMDISLELLDRKCWLISEVFGGKFTPDDVLKELTSADIDQTVNLIIGSAAKVIEKN